jgi:hypothetical protein
MTPEKTPGKSPTGPEESCPPDIAVQLSESILRKAEEMARSEGISLEDFVLYAVAEKIARSEPPDKA